MRNIIILIKKNIFLIFIVILGIFLRFYNLGTNPPELHSDEITNVLSARQILTTGKDINGEFNLYFYNIIESRSPVYGYLSALSTFVFGLNNFAIRLPAAVMGSLTIIFIYLICWELTKNRSASLFAAATASIMPWLVHYSRVGWEPAATIPLLVLSIYLFLKGLKNLNVIIYSYLFFTLTIFTHRSAEFLSPMFLMLLITLNLNFLKGNVRQHIVGISVFLIAFLVLINISISDPLLYGRSSKILTFQEGITRDSIATFSNNYVQHFSIDFLFEKGDDNLRHGTGTNGVLYYTMIPFILIGFVGVLALLPVRSAIFLIFWLLIFPLGGSLTNDGVPHATRTLIGAPLFALLSGVGFLTISKIISLISTSAYLFKAFTIFSVILLLAPTYVFFNKYFNHYPHYSSNYWNYGNAHILNYLNKNPRAFHTACLENINYWDKEVLLNFYVKNADIKIISGTEDESCKNSGVVKLLYDLTEQPNCTSIKYFYNLDHSPMAQFCVVK